jgi:hypothetical protein
MASVSPLPNTTAPIQRSGNLKGASFSFFNLFRISSLISILNPSPRCSLGTPPRDTAGTRLCPLPAGSLMLLKAALPTVHARRTVTVNNGVHCSCLRCPAIIQITPTSSRQARDVANVFLRRCGGWLLFFVVGVRSLRPCPWTSTECAEPSGWGPQWSNVPAGGRRTSRG